MSKHIAASKTLWINLIGGSIALLEAGDFVDVLPPEYQAYIPAALAVLNIINRGFTSQPVRLGASK
ncbi:MAG: hypothetical protein ACPG4X_21220 [Pikeienuella sp.]